MPYFEAIRDRLILYFKLHRLARKPKLVGVTGLSRNAGISTIANGLAAAISDTCDGKVLLVNMNLGHAELSLLNGHTARSLTEVIQADEQEISAVSDNLYLATLSHSQTTSAQFTAKNFYDLLPHIRASDFDYIIFDMAPLSQTSSTVALAGFMDKLLLVIESGKTNLDALSHSFKELASTKADVTCVFNKARSYAPKGIEGEYY